MGPRRKTDGGITIAKCGLQGSAKLRGIEQAANIGFSEIERGQANLFYICAAEKRCFSQEAGGKRAKTEEAAKIFTVDITGEEQQNQMTLFSSVTRDLVDLWTKTNASFLNPLSNINVP